MEGGLLLSLYVAALAAAPTTVVQPPPPQPPPVTQPSYVSELSRAGLKPELFKRPVRPKTSLGSLFSTDDYPLEALSKAEAGSVAVVLKVGQDGKIKDCIVTASSGSPSLDSQTCRIFWQRAEFVPARDSHGKPVESAWRQRINWVLPESDPTPIEAWSTRFTIEFVQDGGIINCDMQATGALRLKDGRQQCGFVTSLWDGALATLRSDAGYRKGKLIFDTQFSPGTGIDQREEPTDARLLARQVVRVTIDASGKPLQCRVVETEGYWPSEDCSDLLEGRYEQPHLQAGAIEATLARAVYGIE